MIKFDFSFRLALHAVTTRYNMLQCVTNFSVNQVPVVVLLKFALQEGTTRYNMLQCVISPNN